MIIEKCIRKDSNFQSASRATVLQTACRSHRRLMREIVEKLCKNEKGRDFGQSSDANMHRMLRDCHLSELAKVLTKMPILRKSLCLFLCFAFKPFFCLSSSIKRLEPKRIFGYSIVKHRKNEKGAATSEVSQENLALPLLKQIRVFKF